MSQSERMMKKGHLQKASEEIRKMSGNPNRSARKGFPVEKEKIDNLRVQVANMVEYVKIEVKVAEDQYNFSPDKGVARYMRALGRLEGIQQVNKIIVELFGDK